MLKKIKDAIQSWQDEREQAERDKEELEKYGRFLTLAIKDMQLTPDELDTLNKARDSFQLSPEEVHAFHSDAIRSVSNSILSDGEVSPQEYDALIQLGNALGVSWNDLPPAQVDIYRLAHQCMSIQKGDLPQMASHLSSINDQEGEIVHAEAEYHLIDERVVRREYRGGSRGVGLRIMKGVTYRFGSSRGSSVPIKEFVPIDQGALTITNQRVAYIGLRKSFSVPWKKILGASSSGSVLHFAFQGRTRSALLSHKSGCHPEIMAAILSYYIR